MIAKINARGSSFAGVTAYLMNGERGAENPDRVAWSQSVNLMDASPDMAARIMAYTDMNREQSGAGRKASEKCVYHYSLSWAQDEAPSREDMETAVTETMARLKLADHQYYMVAHNDRDHSHVHVVANLTHPETRKRASVSFDKRELQKWALEYERMHGLKCEAREKNAAEYEAGKSTKNRDTKQDYAQRVTAAYMAADNGRAFVHALRDHGLELGRARRGSGFVVVDEQGDIQKLARQLNIAERGAAKTDAINKKLSDLQKNDIRDGDEIAARIKASLKTVSREEQDAEQYNKILAAADEHAKKVAAAEWKRTRRLAAFEKKREADYSVRLSKMEARHSEQRSELEQKLKESVGPHLHRIKTDAEKLKTTIEGRGIGKTLRRLWRGRQDRETLATMRQNIGQLETAMTDARGRVAKIQSDEKDRLRKDHEASRSDFRKLAPEVQIDYLKKQVQAERQKQKERGQDRPGIHANDPQQRRLNNQIWQIRQDERKKAADNQALRDQAAQYPKSVLRQQEVEAHRTAKPAPEPAKFDRFARMADRIREQAADRNKDRDFER